MMDVDLESANEILAEVRDVRHSHCRICGSKNEHGLKLKFFMDDKGDVTAEFDCNSEFQGYPGIIHGGVIAAMIDSAMSNCLFARRLSGVTAEFNIRYFYPLWLNRKATVKARIDRSSARLYLMSGEVIQEDRVVASAHSKFMPLPTVAVEE